MTMTGVVYKWERDIAPSHYMLRIESFSKLTTMLSQGGLQYIESKTFKASGYKWNFLVYPNGDEKRNSTGHISVLVRIKDTSALPKKWEIHTDLKFFIYNQLRDKFFIFQVGEACRFHPLKKESGITKLVSRAVFDDAANGYLVKDKCVFGVEVFVLYSKFAEECLRPSVRGNNKTFTWRLPDYSNLGTEIRYSDEFSANSFKWRLVLYPLGNQRSGGENISLLLELVDKKISCAKLLVHFTVCMRDQTSVSNDKKLEYCGFFTPKDTWGWSKFAPLTDLQKFSKGDCIIIEAHIKNVYTIDS